LDKYILVKYDYWLKIGIYKQYNYLIKMEKEKQLSKTSKVEFYDVSRIKAVIKIPPEFEDTLIKFSKNKITSLYKSICLIGATGAGKSSTCNTVCGQCHFKASEALESFTYATEGILTNWYGNKDKESIFVLDTPGLGDSKGRDTEHIAEMICAL
jgi:predicted GTPase